MSRQGGPESQVPDRFILTAVSSPLWGPHQLQMALHTAPLHLLLPLSSGL